MKMDKVAGSKNDEFYTPEYAVRPILKYLKRGDRIWCPFDTDKSNFVGMIREHGSEVVCGHIDTGSDFFAESAPECDAVVSNPPYSMKYQVFERLFSLKLPFAMLVGVVGLFESQRRFELFRDNEFEIMYLSRRVAYLRDYGDKKPSMHPPFSSVYVCQGILPDRIVFEEIKKS